MEFVLFSGVWVQRSQVVWQLLSFSLFGSRPQLRSIFVLPVINQPMAKRAMANIMTTKAIIKVKNKLDTCVSF